MQDIRTNIDDWIAAALAGDLSPEEQTAFDRHLQESGESRALFEETKAMSTAIEETLQTDRPSPGFEARMISGFREKAARPREPLTSRIARWIRLPAFYIPATAVVLIGMVIVGERVTNEPLMTTSRLGMFKESEYATQQDQQVKKGLVLPTAQSGLPENESDGKVVSGKFTDYKGQDAYIGGKGVDMQLGGQQNFNLVDNSAQMPRSVFGRAVTKQRFGSSIYSTTVTSGYSTASSPQDDSAVRDGAMGGSRAEADLKSQEVDKLAANEENAASLSQTRNAPMSNAAPAATAPGVAAQLSAPTIPDARKLIRNASVDLEVKNYDEAMDAIDAMARGSGGYVDTRNSYRLPNGKEAGTVVIKVPPNALDGSLLQLRSLGELKNQNLSTEDVTSQYFDIDARLRNAQKMEGRLLDLLATVKGRVSELLQVERELGRVRENIEQMQGQLKLYDSLVQYATITILLREKDLNQPAAYLLQENVSLSLFSPDVEKAYIAARREAGAVNAQIVQSQLTQQESGGMSAVMRLVIDPDHADALIDSIRGLGRVQDFTKHEERIARDGSGDSATAKEDRDKVTLDLTIMPAEEQPVQFTEVAVQSSSVEQQTARIRQEAAGFDLRGSNFEREADGSEAASMIFRLPLDKYPAFLAQIQDLGEVKGLTVRRQDQNGGSAANAVAEVSLRIYSQPAIVADDNGLFATLRRTLAEAFGGLMWSVRMIGVAVAFLVPWALALAALVWVVRLILRRKSKKQ